jgi:hypothetical protein
MKVPGGNLVENDAPVVSVIGNLIAILDRIILTESSHLMSEGESHL